MNEPEQLIQGVARAIAAGATLPHQASTIGMDLFVLIHIHHLGEEPRVRDLLRNFLMALPGWKLDDLVSRQMLYAIRIAQTAGKIEYEEMHKLFSLCDEIYALRKLGLAAASEMEREFETAIRQRFRKESAKARAAAEDRADEWNRKLWWYAENLA